MRRNTRRNTTGNLASIIGAARTAIARGGARERPGGDIVFDSRRQPIAGVNGRFSLREHLPDLIGADGRTIAAPAATPANETRTIAAAVMENSRVVRAGAHLIEIAEPGFVTAEPEPTFAEAPTRFSVISASPFQKIELDTDAATGAVSAGAGTRDEGDVDMSPLPVSTASIDRDELPQYAVRHEIPRSVLRAHNDEEIEAELMTAFALGLGRVVDAELLSAIEATTPGAWWVSAAAAKGVRWQELQAIVGTAGDGPPTAGERGELYVAGVPADLSPDMASTIIAAFGRFAVAVEPEIDVLIEHTSAGKLLATVWTSAKAMLPDAGFAWAVS